MRKVLVNCNPAGFSVVGQFASEALKSVIPAEAGIQSEAFSILVKE
jgi:hypothetical protein